MTFTDVRMGKYALPLSSQFPILLYKENYLLLTELRDKQRKVNIINRTRDVSVGDIVLVFEDNVKRLNWRTGRVTDLIKGSDGIVRGAVVIVANKDKVVVLRRRRLNKLYPFEFSTSDVQSHYNNETIQSLQEEAPRITFVPEEKVSVFGGSVE